MKLREGSLTALPEISDQEPESGEEWRRAMVTAGAGSCHYLYQRVSCAPPVRTIRHTMLLRTILTLAAAVQLAASAPGAYP